MTTQTMLEKVARAIDPHAFRDDLPEHAGWINRAREQAITKARAAFQALREPTEEMVKVFDETDTAPIVWTWAIDAALQEKG